MDPAAVTAAVENATPAQLLVWGWATLGAVWNLCGTYRAARGACGACRRWQAARALRRREERAQEILAVLDAYTAAGAPVAACHPGVAGPKTNCREPAI